MKKLNAFLRKNALYKRLLSVLLAMTMIAGLFSGIGLAVNAAEKRIYYGDQPESDGYYAAPRYVGYTALSGDLERHGDLYNLYNRPNMISVQGSVESRTDYSRGYTTGDVIIRGKTEMVEKWKIDSFDVDFFFANTDNYYEAYKVQPIKMKMTYKYTKNNGSSRQYAYRGGYYGMSDTPYYSSSDFYSISDFSQGGKWTWFASETHSINGYVSDIKAVFSETTPPRVTRWELQNRENDTPLIWLIFNEELRPAQPDLLNGELLGEAFNVDLEMTPAIDPNGESMTVRAKCVEFVSGGTTGTGKGKLGFEIIDTDWTKLQETGKEWVIRKVIDKCDYSKSYDIWYPYPLADYYKPSGKSQNYASSLPVTDSVGNTFKLGNISNVNKRVDTVDPYINNLFLTGDCLPASNTSNLDLSSWLDLPDMEWSDLFVGMEDSFYATVELNEEIKDLTKEQKAEIYLEWNILDDNGKPLKTYLSEMKDVPYVNGSATISQLVFKPLVLSNAAATESGKQVRPVKLHGGEHLEDFYNNALVESGIHDISVKPDKQVYLDIMGPTVTLGNILKGDNATYSVQLNISDRASEEEGRFFAGMIGGSSNVVGSVSLYSEDDIPAVGYQYTLLPVGEEFSGSYLHSGTLSSKDAQTPVPLEISAEGSYILYLKLENGEGLEIADDSGATLDFTLRDILGNTSQKTCNLTGLELDNVAPTASAQNETVIVAGEVNYAEFNATVTASDLNGISMIEYKWGTDTIITQEVCNHEKNVTFRVPAKKIEGDSVVTDTLEIKVYDKYNNVTALKPLSFSGDLNKYVPQTTYSGDPNYPGNTNDIVISAPLTTGGSTQVDGYVRVVCELPDSRCVIGAGEISADDKISLFGSNNLQWVSATKENNKYINVSELGASGLSDVYGYVDVTIWVSEADLSVGENTPDNPTLSDTEAHVRTAQSMTMSIARTTSRNDVHNVNFGNVTLASGEVIPTNSYQGLDYVSLFPNTFAGTRYPFTISNAVMQEWSLIDLDWNNSYVVLLKADAEGNISENAEEVTNHIPLNAGVNQSLVVPGLDKDGKAFTTGTYVWKVYLAQVAGGRQEFVAPTRLLLDAVEVNAKFGVYSYTNQTSLGIGEYGAYDAGDPDTQNYAMDTLDLVQRNEDGSPLTTINVAVAEPYPGHGAFDIIQDANGRDSYAVIPVNGGGHLNMKISMDTTQLGTSTYMGQQVGVLKGFRYWNANAPVNLDELPFELTSQSNDNAYLQIREYVDWYEDSSIVVDDLSELEAADSHDDFRVTLGKNRIAYQLQLTNGKMSDVMYFDLILRTVAPTVSLEFAPGPGRIHEIAMENGESFQQTHTAYVTADITNYTSVSGGLDVYQLTAENISGNSYVYAMNKVTDFNHIVLTQASHGYMGLPDDNDGLPDIRDLFLAVDEYGNGVVVFPIIGDENDTENTRFENVINPGLGKIESLDWDWSTKYDVTEKGRYSLMINHIYTDKYHENDDIIRVMDGYSVQIDDREPVYIDARPVEYVCDDEGYVTDIINYNEQIENGPNDAGIHAVYDYGGVDFSFPYDPDVALGEPVSHSIKVCAYLNGEVTDEETLNIWKTNTLNLRPTMIIETAEFGQSVFVSKFTDLTDEQLANGDYYSSTGLRFGYADTRLAEGEEFGTNHTVRTMDAGNYTVEFMDKYGEVYTQEMPLNLSEDPAVTFSTTEPTAGGVEVTVTSELYDLYLEWGSYYENDEEKHVLGVPEGTIVEGDGTKTLKLKLYNNSDWFDIEHPGKENEWLSFRGIGVNYGDNESLRIYVDNIYNEPVQPQINWTYTEQEVIENYEVDGIAYPKVVFGMVEAVLVDENGIPLIDSVTGETPRFTFEPGGVTSYTFSGYTNIVGTEGPDITATLPVTLLEYETPVYPDEPEPVQDIWAPNVAIDGTASYNGDAQTVYAAYVNAPARDASSPIVEIAEDWSESWAETYGPDMVFDNSDNLIACFGWADTYRLKLDILDESAVKVFVTASDNSTIPGYKNGRSDVIAGVSLIGRSVVVTQNGTFIIHVVDEEDNAVSIPICVTSLGKDAPTPNYVLVLSKDASQVRAYLMPPNVNGVDNLQITTGTWAPNEEAMVEEDTYSRFYGMPYLVYMRNGNQTLYYSYELNGRTFTGQIDFEINKIDETELSVSAPKWSANYDPNATADNWEQPFIRMTNKNITAQFTANKTISGAYLIDENGNPVPEHYATVSFLGSRITVEYNHCGGPIQVACVSAANNTKTATSELLPAILTIDKDAPRVFEPEIAYSENRRSAVITWQFSEQVVDQATGKYLSKAGAGLYTATETVDSNGTYTFTVSDRAGNRKTATAIVDGLVTDALTMQISTSDSDGGIITDPASYEAEADATLYIKTSRDALVTLDHTDTEILATAGQWTAVTIKESLSGLYPIIRAVDEYGNCAIIQLESVPLRDGNAPVVILRKNLINAPLNSTTEEMTALLKSNLLVSDETTPTEQLEFNFEYNVPVNSAKVNVTYKVTDTSGNTATCTGQIRFYSDKELIVGVNGEAIERDDTVVVQKGEINLAVDAAGEPYKIMWKTGIKTVAQTKNNAKTLTSYTDEAKTYEPAFDAAGYYTIVITTQSQDTYRIILYVED